MPIIVTENMQKSRAKYDKQVKKRPWINMETGQLTRLGWMKSAEITFFPDYVNMAQLFGRWGAVVIRRGGDPIHPAQLRR